MKLEQLSIEEYRVLRDLTLHFERTTSRKSKVTLRQGYSLDFLAGVNGTGKTTALQFIARLFAHLYNTDHFDEPFDIAYTIGSVDSQHSTKKIRITNVPGKNDENTGEDKFTQNTNSQFQYQVDGGELTSGKLPTEYLPGYVIVYSTGSEEEWEQALLLNAPEEDNTPSQQEDKSRPTYELPGHRPDVRLYDEEQPLDDANSKLLFIRKNQLPLVALCGLIASRWFQVDNKSQGDVLANVLQDIALEPLAGFSLRVRSHPKLTEPGQIQIIQLLEGVADQIVHSGADRLLLFDIESQLNKKVANQPSIFNLYTTPIELFRSLHTLYKHRPFYDPPLQEVNIFFHRINKRSNVEQEEKLNSDVIDVETDANTPMLLLYDWLSDGERSFLARMALFALFRSDDLLILLDEPEVHFNDVWKRQIVQKLDEIMRGCSSHAIITTHSSIALSDVPSEDVLVLRRNGKFTSGEEHSSGIETFGADPSDIMVHVFGTLSPNGERSRTFIREEIGKRKTVQALNELSDIVAPGYWRYRIQLEAQSIEGRLQ